MTRVSGFALLAVSALALAGCDPYGRGPVGGPKQAIGTVGGAVAGGIIGNQIGKGEGKAVATTIGVIAGGLIGNQIGAGLDELDRRRAQEAEYRALEYGRSGSPVAWQNPDTGHYGEVVPTAPYQRGGTDCRDYTHTIYINGRPETARGTACRQPDGTWRTG
ncbi:MAG: glycine zipper 2TM domain-containing protein [Rhodobiaceae bacterium]|nr:glycine zipper 2TM domain-containing protein [Rhodobiaceae bacterium]